MTRIRCSTALVLSLMLLITPATRADDQAKSTIDPSGTWRWEHEEQGLTVKDMLRLNYDPETGELTGNYEGRIGPIELEEAEIEGDELSCEFEVEYEGGSFEVEFEGNIDGDTITGVVEISSGQESQEFPWVATRSVNNDDVLGTWDIRIELEGGNTLTPSLKITKDGNGQLVGEYTSTNADIELNLDELAVRDNRLTFTISAELDGNLLTAKYDVTPRGNKFNGSVAYDFNGQTGEIEVAAVRPAEDDDKDDDNGDDVDGDDDEDEEGEQEEEDDDA